MKFQSKSNFLEMVVVIADPIFLCRVGIASNESIDVPYF